MYRIKFLFLIIALCGGLNIFCQDSYKKVTMTYESIKFFTPTYHFAELTFIIKNNSKDTLFISNQNIRIELKKDGTVLQNHPPSQAFPPLASTTEIKKDKEESKRQQKINKLKLQFAKKIIIQNFGKKAKTFDEKWLTEQIIDNCLVIFPQESISYKEYFWNDSLDKNCSVKGLILESNLFLEFYDKKQKLQELYYLPTDNK